jgi:hypothetical protein
VARAGRAPGRSAALSVPVAPVRSCKLAVVIERGLARTPAPDQGGRYPRRRLTSNTGTAVTRFDDERDVLGC